MISLVVLVLIALLYRNTSVSTSMNNLNEQLSNSVLSKFPGVYWSQVLGTTLFFAALIYLVVWDISNYSLASNVPANIENGNDGTQPMEISDNESTCDDSTQTTEISGYGNDGPTLKEYSDCLDGWAKANGVTSSELEENKRRAKEMIESETRPVPNELMRTRSMNNWYEAGGYYQTPDRNSEFSWDTLSFSDLN